MGTLARSTPEVETNDDATTRRRGEEREGRVRE
jgi:hypothetical protein